MMATPVLYKDQRLDFMPRLLPPLRTTELPVYYATTRAPATPGDPEHYGNAPGQELRLGVAYVRLGEPGWTFDQLAASDWTSTVAKPRPGEVERVEELGPVPREQTMSEAERQLVARIDARLATLRNPMVVLYVPGYRVTFDDVAVMMGSLSAYLGRGAMVTFPSRGVRSERLISSSPAIGLSWMPVSWSSTRPTPTMSPPPAQDAFESFSQPVCPSEGFSGARLSARTAVERWAPSSTTPTTTAARRGRLCHASGRRGPPSARGRRSRGACASAIGRLVNLGWSVRARTRDHHP
jgi:hypothetical protein